MKEITTQSGFHCQLRDNWNDDIELLELLVQVDEGKLQTMPTVLERILGADGKKQLYDHLRKDGVVSISAVQAALMEIVTLGGGKNS